MFFDFNQYASVFIRMVAVGKLALIVGAHAPYNFTSIMATIMVIISHALYCMSRSINQLVKSNESVLKLSRVQWMCRAFFTSYFLHLPIT